MWIFIVLVLSVILVLIFFALCNWRIEITYQDGELTIKAGRLKLFSTADKKKPQKPKPKKEIKLEHIKTALIEARDVYKQEKYEIISLLKESSRMFDYKVFNVSVNFGFGDAAVTGIANGVVWSGITGMVTLLKRYIDIENKTNIAVYPNYTQACFDVDSCLVLETRIIRFLSIAPRAKKLYERNKEKISNIRMVVS